MTGLHNESLNYIEWSKHHILNPWGLGRRKNCGSLKFLVANHWACTWLVCCILCPVLRRPGAEKERQDTGEKHPLSLSMRSSLADLHRLTGKKQRIQAKFRRCQHPWFIWPTEVLDFRKRVVVSDPIKWIPFCGECLVYLEDLVKYPKWKENLNLIQSDEQSW